MCNGSLPISHFFLLLLFFFLTPVLLLLSHHIFLVYTKPLSIYLFLSHREAVYSFTIPLWRCWTCYFPPIVSFFPFALFVSVRVENTPPKSEKPTTPRREERKKGREKTKKSAHGFLFNRSIDIVSYSHHA